MRLFKNYLFNGNGGTSHYLYLKLLDRLDAAISLNSAMEQGMKATKHDRQELEDIVHDIAAAILGREIKIGKKISIKMENNIPIPNEWIGNGYKTRRQDALDQTYQALKKAAKLKIVHISDGRGGYGEPRIKFLKSEIIPILEQLLERAPMCS